MLQTLLLLPELGNVAINDTNSDPVKTSNRPSSPGVMPTLELVNGEVVSDSGYQSFPSTENQPKVSVNGLTASWTDVSSLYCIEFSKMFIHMLCQWFGLHITSMFRL